MVWLTQPMVRELISISTMVQTATKTQI